MRPFLLRALAVTAAVAAMATVATVLASPVAAERRHRSAPGHCLRLQTELYCWGFGFTQHEPGGLAPAGTSRVGPRGDLSYQDWWAQRAALPESQRNAADQRELAQARRALPGVLRLRQALEQYRQGRGANRAAGLPFDLPAESTIMTGKQIKQERSYWCGPATMQSIAWGSNGVKGDQATWAARLGTRTNGTAISSIVDQINARTKWSKPSYAGEYYVLDVSDASVSDFYFFHQFVLGGALGNPAPVVEHPKLIRSSFKYLKYDHKGHFQVGRGYRTLDGTPMIKIFEVFNERDYRADGNTTWGPREVSAKLLLSATKANVDHQNIGL